MYRLHCADLKQVTMIQYTRLYVSGERNFIKIAWKLNKYLPSFIYDLKA